MAPWVENLWLYVAAPLVGLAAAVLTIRLRAPQLMQVGAAFRAFRQHDAKAEGSVHPATAIALNTAAAYGGAAAVGAATAVSLGGAGAIAWVWLFGILLAPFRVAEVVLSRTAPAGEAGAAKGTLTHRLLADTSPLARGLGLALLVLVPLAGFAFVGGVHGEAVAGAAGQLLEGAAIPLGLGVALLAIGAAVMPVEKVGTTLGWVAAVALIALFGAGMFGIFGAPGRGFAAFGRALTDAMDGASTTGAFSGALAGEIALAALLHLLPPIAATGGIEGAWHAEAQAPTTKGYAGAGLTGPFLYVVMTTVIGFSLVATNAFNTPVETTRALDDVRFYRVGFETVSQRREPERLYTGVIRITDGETGVVEIHAGTERGMVRAPTFLDRGEPANIAIHVTDGVVDNLQRPGELDALVNQPLSDTADISLSGRMLPEGGALLGASMQAAGGTLISRVALAALLLLAALGAAAWGFGVRKTLEAKVDPAMARWAGALPGLGMALAASGAVAGFSAVGSLVAGVLVSVVAIALMAKSGDASR